MSDSANVSTGDVASASTSGEADGTPYRRVFIRVIAVEVFVLLMLWALQARYSR